jgi:hypothetical protein
VHKKASLRFFRGWLCRFSEEISMRAFMVLLHRYIGLATAVFLLLARITDSHKQRRHELAEPGIQACGFVVFTD